VAYVRTVRTASGATAVQIVHGSRRGARTIEHVGSAHDELELEALKAAARQRLAAGQAQLDLGLDPCGVPKRSPGPVAWRFSAAQAIRRYSLITPPRTRFRRIGASSGMTVAGSWFGGRWSRPWCGR
jgi:hypothetical protein